MARQAPAHEPAVRRRLPIGAEVHREQGVHFRVWAPAARHVTVVIDDALHGRERPLEPDAVEGYFSGLVREAAAGTRYRFRLDEGEAYPDPASRFQPDGPHGPSVVVDPATYAWRDEGWSGVPRSGMVVYEMHIGTFTREGTWHAAIAELPALAEVGITVLEVMPVADFPGRFGWGYDGVNLFAPTRLYGAPDDFRAFVDAAHALELAVILDVVYNHFGPDGCWMDRYSPHYFSARATEWGRAINFDGEACEPVREFYTSNAHYWIEEFHLDGLRLDASHAIVDWSHPHILAEIVAAVRSAGAGRDTWIVSENEAQQSVQARPEADAGHGLDAMWNDDFHHTAMVALTGHREAYYTDYLGTPQEFISAAKYGFLYQGQWYSWQQQARGTSTAGMRPESFVAYHPPHDQVANSWRGERIHTLTSPGRLRALTAVLLLGPATPMLFQGQEFAASTPFMYFADHQGDLARQVRKGRREFMAQFTSVAHAEIDDGLPDPGAVETFERSKLDPRERDTHRQAVALHASLIQLRSSHPAFLAQGRSGFDGAVIADQAFVMRFYADAPSGPCDEQRLLVVNLGRQLDLQVLPEPLLAPPSGRHWSVLWSSEDPLYGGSGTPDVILPRGWRLPAESAIVFCPVEGPH